MQHGDRVAVFLPNMPQYHMVFFGILKAGAVHVPVSPMSRAFELAHELNDTDAVLLVALDELDAGGTRGRPTATPRPCARST